MFCPKCEKEMIAVERNDIELDWCMFCEGFWFDFGEWNILCKKLIAEDLTNSNIDIFELPKIKTGEKLYRCPVCSKKMEKFIFNDVILDRCPNRHGIWFDKNEFSECVNYMNSGNSKFSKSNGFEQIKFLGEVFNIKK